MEPWRLPKSSLKLIMTRYWQIYGEEEVGVKNVWHRLRIILFDLREGWNRSNNWKTYLRKHHHKIIFHSLEQRHKSYSIVWNSVLLLFAICFRSIWSENLDILLISFFLFILTWLYSRCKFVYFFLISRRSSVTDSVLKLFVVCLNCLYY